jgi:hypothetical protein
MESSGQRPPGKELGSSVFHISLTYIFPSTAHTWRQREGLNLLKCTSGDLLGLENGLMGEISRSFCLPLGRQWADCWKFNRVNDIPQPENEEVSPAERTGSAMSTPSPTSPALPKPSSCLLFNMSPLWHWDGNAAEWSSVGSVWRSSNAVQLLGKSRSTSLHPLLSSPLFSSIVCIVSKILAAWVRGDSFI